MEHIPQFECLVTPRTIHSFFFRILDSFVEILKFVFIKHKPHAVERHWALMLKLLANLFRLIYQLASATTTPFNINFFHLRPTLDEGPKIIRLGFLSLTHNEKTYFLGSRALSSTTTN